MVKDREGVGTPVLSTTDLLLAARQQPRMIYWFQVPPRIGEPLGIERIGMVELLTGEELMATKRVGTELVRLGFELAKEAVRFINNEPVNTGDGTADAFWGRPGKGMSKIRQLILTAYGQIHNPETEDVASFLKSLSTTVG